MTAGLGSANVFTKFLHEILTTVLLLPIGVPEVHTREHPGIKSIAERTVKIAKHMVRYCNEIEGAFEYESSAIKVMEVRGRKKKYRNEESSRRSSDFIGSG